MTRHYNYQHDTSLWHVTITINMTHHYDTSLWHIFMTRHYNYQHDTSLWHVTITKIITITIAITKTITNSTTTDRILCYTTLFKRYEILDSHSRCELSAIILGYIILGGWFISSREKVWGKPVLYLLYSTLLYLLFRTVIVIVIVIVVDIVIVIVSSLSLNCDSTHPHSQWYR